MKAVVTTFLWIAASLAFVFPSPAGAQSDPKSRAPAPTANARPLEPGPRGKLSVVGRVDVGDVAPDFELSGTRGGPVAISRLRGDWVLLVFARRLAEFDDFSPVTSRLAEHGVRVFGITREGPSKLRTHSQRAAIPFELLADPTGDVSAIYGLNDAASAATRPGYVLIDRRGTVRLAVLGQSFAATQVAELVDFTIAN
ncbi:MAG: redoxin domain-containing protein [Candidatus Eisenbacteria bacterium]|uniref:Redoxin domain-containing protein n=1 Tax=Eiseniibacteriota bacterium TaxID=2212470 RepID=A0A849SEN3_UNCEI|nr:redoxin domain-containing protein [Candidatus Eisenbacteria bacterium]